MNQGIVIGPLLKVSGLKKAYGAIQAVGGVSFEVMPGEIFGVIGPNGSGKTERRRRGATDEEIVRVEQ